MKVKVKDLLPNPHRRIKEYEIQPERVQMLINSIKETFFWDNLIARPAPKDEGKYEIAYGHHRLAALRKLKIEEIDIPVKDINDFTMLKIMADENAEEYSMQPAVLNETVLSVKRFLEEQIQDKTWGDIQTKPQESLRLLFESARTLSQVQAQGVGEPTIKKFLGANYSAWRIQEALASLREDPEKFDRKAAERMKSVDAAATFRKAVKDYKIPKPEQRKLADKLSGRGAGAPEVLREVRKAAAKPEKQKGDPLIIELQATIEAIETQMLALTNKLAAFNAKARALDITEIGGLTRLFNLQAIRGMLHELDEYRTLLGPRNERLQIGGRNE